MERELNKSAFLYNINNLKKLNTKIKNNIPTSYLCKQILFYCFFLFFNIYT